MEHETTTTQAAVGLTEFIAKHGQSQFHAIEGIKGMLDGFEYLPEAQHWALEPGKSYYTTRNASSIVAFKVPGTCKSYHFQIASAHSDAPTFKLKPNPTLSGPAAYTRLNVEPYGGVINYTWFDRPLAIAGRAMVRHAGGVESRLFSTDACAIIPSIAIHMNRGVNDGFASNPQIDLCPLVSADASSASDFTEIIARSVCATAEDVVSFEAQLVNLQQPLVWGEDSQFVSAPRLDDLACAYSAASAFIQAGNQACITVLAVFDNEEVGSNTKQGACSTFLADTLARINAALGKTAEDYHCALAKSFMVSCDNAHAMHPNHPEATDEGNRPMLNGGIVVKDASNQKYCSDAFSRAVFLEVCRNAGVPIQAFSNRSDKTGGSTLGNLSNTQVSLHGVDVGIAQLAMHSSFETAGAYDVAHAGDALRAYFETCIEIDEAQSFRLN